jgi:sterol desaturase/sphingolipid hydroxylase (fatty acid hydroxylase superfamily)
MMGIIVTVFLGCFILERALPGWEIPTVRTWPLRVLVINGVQMGVVVLAGYSWERWLSAWSVFHLSQHVDRVAGGLIAYFIATFVFYWWHRWRHEVDFLWRGFHQIHHSPQRI